MLVNDKINKMISEISDYREDQILEEKTFDSDLLMDDDDMLELRLELEDEFLIDITDDEIREIHTVKELYDLVSECIER